MRACWQAIAEVDEQTVLAMAQLETVMVDFKKAVHPQLNVQFATILTEAITNDLEGAKVRVTRL